MKQNKKNIKKEISEKAVANNQKQLPFDLSRYGYIIIILLITIIYSQTLTFDFTKFEDDYLISNNLINLSNIDNLDDIFFHNSFLSEYNLGFYRPLQTLSYMMDTILGGANPAFYHFTNLIIHILTCYFIFLLFKKLNYNNNLSLFIAIIYSVHPLFVHTVVWLPSRGDLLLCLFAVLSFLSLIKYNENKGTLFLILNLLFLLLAVLSKETALLLPIIYFIWLFIIQKNKITTSNSIILIIFWLAINSFAYIMRLITVEDVLKKEDFGIIPFINNLATIPEVIGKFIVPVNIQVMPNFNILNTSIGLFVIFGIITLFLFQIKLSKNEKTSNTNSHLKYKQILFGLSWFLILFLPGMFYGRKFTDSDHLFDYQDHRNYLPLIGFVIILLEIIPFYLKKLNLKKLFPLSIFWILLLSVITFVNSKQYSNPITFFSSAIKDNPNISGLYFLRAGIYKDKGNLDASLLDYSKTIKLNPQHADAFNNRASIRAIQGNYLFALNDLNQAIKLAPQITESYYNRAVIKASLGDTHGAIKDYSTVISKNPKDFSAIFERGNLFLKINDFQNAIADFEKAIKYNSRNPDSYFYLGIAYYRFGKLQLACQSWEKAMSLGNKSASGMIQNYCK
ncbi:tetratricopeptide repeat protein [Bacteroidetes/Chlorobi group bacterium ChocPot_Mid]|nr:MAG: tetratricopeptide repeat protein [Bacteroidetes/Chlorobi group bacterium ChocPot_Mid]